MEDNLYTSSFKENILFVLKTIIFIACAVPVIYFLGNKYSVASTENLVNTYNQNRWDEFYAQPENSIDMVFLGSSHSYCTFDPLIIDEGLGTNSYQLGMPLQHLDSTYYTLREVLNYQQPEDVVLEVYWDMLDDEFELTQAGYLFQVMRNEELEKEYIKEVFPLSEKVKYNINIFRYQADYFAYRNSKLKEKIENNFGVYTPQTEKQEGIEQYRSKGYTYCNYNMLPDEYDKTNQFKNTDGKEWEPKEAQLKYLYKIIELCNENNIRLTFVTAPVANVSLDYIENYDVIHDYIQNIADENDIKYLDYNIVNKDKTLFADENFRDDAHLNHSGVEIADEYFINWYKENYN